MFADYCFEAVSNFQYFGSTVSEGLYGKEEIRERIAATNRAYFALSKILRTRVVTQSTKFRLYKTLIRPVVPYGGESWILNRSAVELLGRL